MTWRHMRLAVALFWLTIGASVLSAESVKLSLTLTPLALVALAVVRRSEDMPVRRKDGPVFWTMLAALVLVLLVGDGVVPTPLPTARVAGVVRNPAVIVPLWLVFAVLIWRRYYPAARAATREAAECPSPHPRSRPG